MKKSLDELARQIKNCQKCELRFECTQVVPGIGQERAKYFILGEAPGREEDSAGVPFVGLAGKRLNKLIALAKIDINDCYLTNVVKCRPPKNRQPGKKEIKACLPWLLAELEAVEFKTIITLGATPLSLFSTEGVRQLHGTMLEGEVLESWLK